MQKKKIAIIGKGTAGCMSAAFYAKRTNCDIDWYFDPDIMPQSVGEGSNLVLPVRLNEFFAFGARDFSKIDGTIKTGIYKENWGKSGVPFLHDFPSPSTALHFSAPKLQQYIYEKLEGTVNVLPSNVSADNIDADFVVDCSGKPDLYGEHIQSEYIPVNSVYVTQCYWDFPRFNHTLTIARPYGWVFGIPLANRCSIGYMYNSDITSLEEVMADVQNIFDAYNLLPSKDTNAFSFKNYRRKDNFNGNISYNGNASFFLEPLEATSFSTVDAVNSITQSHWFGGSSKDLSEERYNHFIDANESLIMLHYAAGSSFKSAFWDYAQERGRLCMENASESFKLLFHNSNTPTGFGTYTNYLSPIDLSSEEMQAVHACWWEGSFAQNKEGLGVETI